MNASQRAYAMSSGEGVRDGYDRPLRKNSKNEWINECGDTPCPNDGEMTNKKCWKCGWIR